MNTVWPEKLPSDRTSAIDELVRGQESAKKLKVVLSGQSINEDHEGSSVPPADLVMEILNSFTNTLSILNRVVDSDEVSQFPASTYVGSPCWDGGRKSEESGESSKSTPTTKDRRGCYKRRKTSHSWTKDTPDLVDDGHAWRKYGQKVILKAKYPRNYFRCTHKFDQGCQAIKQVQRIEDEPAMYRTTYYGHHTCKNFLKASHQHLIIDSPDDNDSSIILSFTNKQNNNNNNKPFFTSFPSSSSSIKQEYDKDDTVIPLPHDHNHLTCNNQSSSSDYLLSPHDHAADVISGMNSSSTTSTTTHELGLDIDMIVKSVGHHFDDDVLESFACFYS